MSIYRRDYPVDLKADDSPVTQADLIAERLILKALSQLALGIPVVAEEAVSAGNIPAIGNRFFLVDPLDGTKEFVRKCDEFTVNIALIEGGKPVFGLIYAPAKSEFYITTGPMEAKIAVLDPEGPDIEFSKLKLTKIKVKKNHGGALDIVASKSHMTDETKDYIDRFAINELKHVGSSLKFCLVAHGKADLYARFGPTMEWDIAAGHAILNAAGGIVARTDGSPLLYGKASAGFLNPFFIAACHSTLVRQS